MHFQHNVLVRVPKAHKQIVAAMIHTAFAQGTPENAHRQWREAADRLRPQFDKAAELMDREGERLDRVRLPKSRWLVRS